MDKKTKKSKFINVIIIVVSIVIIIVLSSFFLDTTGKINQGYFRINDLVVNSKVEVHDKETEQQSTTNTTDKTTETNKAPINNLSDLTLDVSQKNEVSFLIATSQGIDPSSIYIDNVKVNYPALTENMYLYQNENNKIDLKSENIKLLLTKEDRDGQFFIKLNIDNVNCVKNATIQNTEASAVKFDGTIFNVLKKKLSDIQFNISFDLNIVDSTGKTNSCKVNLNLPNELLLSNGISIVSENPGNFPFRIK